MYKKLLILTSCTLSMYANEIPREATVDSDTKSEAQHLEVVEKLQHSCAFTTEGMHIVTAYLDDYAAAARIMSKKEELQTPEAQNLISIIRTMHKEGSHTLVNNNEALEQCNRYFIKYETDYTAYGDMIKKCGNTQFSHHFSPIFFKDIQSSIKQHVCLLMLDGAGLIVPGTLVGSVYRMEPKTVAMLLIAANKNNKDIKPESIRGILLFYACLAQQ